MNEKYQIEIGGKMTELGADDFLSLCKKHSLKISYDIFTGRLAFTGDSKKVEAILSVLDSCAELEAAVMCKLSESNGDLKYILEERAAIMKDSKPERVDIFTAALSNVRGERNNYQKIQGA